MKKCTQIMYYIKEVSGIKLLILAEHQKHKKNRHRRQCYHILIERY